ncbi:hypothetical protein [Shewanella psychrophila]|nr:hypothetical protein [Shewanella psychrophila]
MTPSTTDVPQGTVVLPYQPTRLSYGVVPKHLPKLEKENLKIVQVVSMVDRRKEEHRTFTLDKVKNENAKVIAQRSIYERVAGLGRTVFDPALKGMYGIREAKKEMTELFLEASK